MTSWSNYLYFPFIYVLSPFYFIQHYLLETSYRDDLYVKYIKKTLCHTQETDNLVKQVFQLKCFTEVSTYTYKFQNAHHIPLIVLRTKKKGKLMSILYACCLAFVKAERKMHKRNG